jgi:hypothetical protein
LSAGFIAARVRIYRSWFTEGCRGGICMPDALSFGEIDGLPVELLPTRTLLSLFSAGGRGGNGGNDSAGNALFNMMSSALGQVNSAGSGVGGAAGSANAGHGG